MQMILKQGKGRRRKNVSRENSGQQQQTAIISNKKPFRNLSLFGSSISDKCEQRDEEKKADWMDERSKQQAASSKQEGCECGKQASKSIILICLRGLR